MVRRIFDLVPEEISQQDEQFVVRNVEVTGKISYLPVYMAMFL